MHGTTLIAQDEIVCKRRNNFYTNCEKENERIGQGNKNKISSRTIEKMPKLD